MPPKKVEPIVNGGVRFGRASKSLKMGIVGLPNVGKSSLFNLLTKTSGAEVANFPFCTIDPNEARCSVPDARYDILCDMWNPPSKYPAFLQVWDIAGLIRGASEGLGLGNKFLSHIGAVDGIFHMVRAFDNAEITHVDDVVDPIRDLDTITYELCRKDLTAVDAAISREEKEVKKTPGFKLSDIFVDTMSKVKALLEANHPVKDADWSTPEIELIKEKLPELVTTKPQVYLVNLSKADFERKRNKHLAKIMKWIQEHGGGPMIPISIEWEEEYAAITDPVQREAFCKLEGTEVAVKSSLSRVITEGYAAIDLIFFITAGEKEVRCWTIPRGWTAPQAAGTIHSDMEKHFIKAEVVAWSDFFEIQKTKGMNDVKAAGKYRQEGRAYVMQDGDIVYFQVGKKG